MRQFAFYRTHRFLLIEKGYIRLDGYDYGFIGGASAYLKESNILLFSGNISIHPDFERIKIFCQNNDVDIDYIDGMDLTDIGGIFFIHNKFLPINI